MPGRNEEQREREERERGIGVKEIEQGDSSAKGNVVDGQQYNLNRNEK